MQPLPDFENPPVLEVVFGVQFPPVPGLQTRHFGEFWDQCKKDFPITHDAPPLPMVLDVGSVELFNLPPFRRMMMISSDNSYVVQVQEDRFNVNWRKVTPEQTYPRFENVFKTFGELWDRFGTFITVATAADLKPGRYELTYVNHIDPGDSEYASGVEANVVMFNWSRLNPNFLPLPRSVSAAWQFELPSDKGHLNANLTHGKRAERELMVLNMTCNGPASSGWSLNEWFETAHEWIVRGFADLTTDSAHARWGRKK
jgi:uncharacterized protein (TIGR04255 family)